jgi:hypothetical protein
MKTWKKIVLLIIGMNIIMYFCFSFIGLSFNIGDWDLFISDGYTYRIFTCILEGFIISGAIIFTKD